MGQLMEELRALRAGDCICDSDRLQNGGRGVRFLVEHQGQTCPAFVVRHAGRAVAFLNRCAHKLVELDWQEGHFFDAQQQFLVCATHGALYDPATGICVGGPCPGARLMSVSIAEAAGRVCLAAATG